MKKIGIILIILVIAGIVAVSGCTSSSDSYTPSSTPTVKTSNYDADTGITSGTTSDGYGYAYNDKYAAVSDGQTTYVTDGENVYEYSR
jgi:hypothetical protein